MVLLLCGQQCTQPLSLTTAKVSIPSASLQLKTCNYLCYSNETDASDDMHHVHSLQRSEMLVNKTLLIFRPILVLVQMYLYLFFNFYYVNHKLWSIKSPGLMQIRNVSDTMRDDLE